MISISNGHMSANFRTRGAALHSLYVKGVDHSVVFGSSSEKTYDQPANYLGAIVGPVANRLRHARAKIGDEFFEFDQNFGEHILHGGRLGISEINWEVLSQGSDFVVFSIRLKNGHMGFPGPIDLNVEYRLDGAALEINIHGNSAVTTLLNLAPHIYFNLSGAPSVTAHKLQIDAKKYLPVDHEFIATGEILDVKGTAFDFLDLRQLGNVFIDHSYVLMKNAMPALTLSDDKVQMRMTTNQNTVQIYTAEHFNGQGFTNFQGDIVGHSAAIAIEPQNFPNAPEYPQFPSIELSAGDEYINTSRFEFVT